MDLESIRVGQVFRCGDRLFRCTDKGQRVVVAIRVDCVTVASNDGRTWSLTGEQAEAEGWFNGPPYAVAETVFDEDDLTVCEPLD
ncbi:MAG: hypothetical protein KDA90_23010 [Planctomycetaceae bacterium]|nr:hypothetical protein [Planctomycetaceae bacterium]MCC0067117.1 hypothetical protein [Rhodovulum sp.]